MKPTILVCCLLFLLPREGDSQVRVGRGMGSERRKHKTYNEETPKPAAPAVRPVAVVPEIVPEKTNEVDEYFYIRWDRGRKLAYSDFKCTKAPCRPLVTEKETDLLRTIYPNYQAFYNMLEKSRQADTAYGGTMKRADSLKQAINEKLDNLYAGSNYSVSVDYNIALSREIDSPAASALVISPVIYNVDETTYYYNIAALFSKFDSWMIIKSADILQHEQIHFDIFELYARKLRKQWVEVLKKNFQEGGSYDLAAQLNPVYDRLYKELYKVQAEFDEQTSELTGAGAPLLQLNEQWSKRVAADLEQLKEYEKPEATVILK
jgi:hypothetical protein